MDGRSAGKWKVIDISYETVQAGGKIGLWAKADALTYFDDFKLSILD